MAGDYTRCPACRHRTVRLHLARRGEDYYRCTYHPRFVPACGWTIYAAPEHWDQEGRAQLAAYEALNPTTEPEA